MSSDVAAPVSVPTDAPPSILSPAYRATTIGMVALISLHAFEALAVAAAMPTVAHELDGLRLYALAFGGTLATSVIGMTLAGRWSDQRGPARPLWLGLACFIAGLLVAGLAQHMPVLVLGRLMQGLGAGAISVALYVLVGRTFPEPMRPRVFAAFSAGWVVPSLVGPGISGLIVQHLGWRWVFLAVPLLAVPAALLLRPALRNLAPASAAPGDTTVVRWAIGAAAAALLLYIGGQQQGWAALALLLPAVALLALCSWKLLPAGTLRLRRGLPSVIALRAIAASAFFGCEAFLPLLLQRERGLSPLLAGVALSLGALGWFSGSWLQGHQQRGWSRRQLLQAGALLMCVGIVITALALHPSVPLWLALAGWSLTGLGMGLVYPSLSVLTLSLSPPAQQGANTSALQLSEALGVATTLAVSGSLFALFLQGNVIVGYLLTYAIMLALAVASVAVARRV
ncbi:MFS transporter [Stenotrophomonas rhizophila]|uniref:MFS transporter n=1 Tax=Stenotrophomonas rhizophila TaxID=216778 RepID=UPI001E5D910A|nr:MFS transporter [Stenotrophomonas rhizophila]MCC7635119.1 MFS transporter [Stenotrophomonas rhizophila]MCC7664865.1 MFS transporter [Stenotrophomonas rhizophila]